LEDAYDTWYKNFLKRRCVTNRLLTLHLLSFKRFLFFFSPHQVCLRTPT